MRHKKPLQSIIVILALAALTVLLAKTASAQVTYKTLYAFTGGADGNEYMDVVNGGNWFSSGLVFGADGALYGTTAAGGNYGYGVVFNLSPNPDGSWTESVLYSFTGGSDGAYPFAGLIFDNAGNLYGTTSGGGLPGCSNAYTTGCGVVFELTPNLDGTWTEAILYSFTGGADGAQPETRLAFDAFGNLYGTADARGLNSSGCGGYWGFNYDGGCGVAFELTPNPDGTWTQTVLHQFTGGADGAKQIGPVALDAAGNLYTTAQGGKTGNGAVLKLARIPTGWKGNILYSFKGLDDGGDPFSFTGLVFDGSGNLYGTTFWGQFPEAGTVFRLVPKNNGSSKWQLVHNFGTSNSYHPVAGVIFDSAGNLYGTTTSGGPRNLGEVFMITPGPNGGAEFTVLYDFSNQPLSCPFSLILDAAGNLYGTTCSSNTGAGGVFEIIRQQ